MKIIPSNQTLILASERGASGGAPYSDRPHADSQSVLTRLTLVAVQADYAPAAQPRTVTSWNAIETGDIETGDGVGSAPSPGPPALRQSSSPALRQSSPALRPIPAGIALYDRIGREPLDAQVRHIDVHA